MSILPKEIRKKILDARSIYLDLDKKYFLYRKSTGKKRKHYLDIICSDIEYAAELEDEISSYLQNTTK